MSVKSRSECKGKHRQTKRQRESGKVAATFGKQTKIITDSGGDGGKHEKRSELKRTARTVEAGADCVGDTFTLRLPQQTV